ncbi:hypothetical protein VTL71DRAFT_13291 [Oculimacula yallundae]|uniref:Uncharacterized protein n=1 Tax=Oculimacula yallundae TaxID=86028 RepID=A0ABR4CJY2_9HELO
MSRAEAEYFQYTVEAQPLSAIIDSFQACQKWCVECLSTLYFSEENVKWWYERLGENVYQIEKACDGTKWEAVREKVWREEAEARTLEGLSREMELNEGSGA